MRVKTALAWAGCVVWLAAVVTAMLAVWAYKTTDNGTARAPARWPSESRIAIAPERAAVLLFAHPQCPCTKASMAELARLAARVGDAAAIHVVLVRPAGTAPDFTAGELAERAAQIAGAKIFVDDGGREAARFAALTSGTVVVYAGGELRFTGGITNARGHEGKAAAQDQIAAIVQRAERSHEIATAPTFGCALRD